MIPSMELGEKKNISVILAEHNYDAAFQMADYVVVMRDGGISRKFIPDEFSKKCFLENNLYN